MKKFIYTVVTLVMVSVIFSRPLPSKASDDHLSAYIDRLCEERSICPEFIRSIIYRESKWDPKAVNGNCQGLMQINPTYQRERMVYYGVTDLFDPYSNVLIGIDYVEELFEKYEDPYAVLMFYNGGYSKNKGIKAYEVGNYSDYAVEISKYSYDLERQNNK